MPAPMRARCDRLTATGAGVRARDRKSIPRGCGGQAAGIGRRPLPWPAVLLGSLLAALSGTPTAAAAGEIPIGCRFGDSPGQTATLACYQDLDRNGDGALSAEEADVLPRIQGRFERLDADGNGLLSPDEFQGGLTTPPQRSGAKGV
jgi:hypothetical protein